MVNDNMRIVNPVRDIYDKTIFGTQRVLTFRTGLQLHYVVRSKVLVGLRLRYFVTARYTGDEPTIEDIYSYATNNTMALGCIDGPALPFRLANTK